MILFIFDQKFIWYLLIYIIIIIFINVVYNSITLILAIYNSYPFIV